MICFLISGFIGRSPCPCLLYTSAALVQEKWPDWVGLLQRSGIDTEKLSAHFAALDWKSILHSISSERNTWISSVANVAGSTVSAIADVAISLVITFYVLIGWRELSSQSKRALLICSLFWLLLF